MITITIGLDEETVERVDQLVRRGLYRTRSEAMRDQIVKGLERISLLEDREESLKKVDRLASALVALKKAPTILPSEKSAVNIISEERDS